MKLIATKSFTYNTRRINPGDIFEAKDPDGRLLVGVLKARKIEDRAEGAVPAPKKEVLEKLNAGPKTATKIPENATNSVDEGRKTPETTASDEASKTTASDEASKTTSRTTASANEDDKSSEPAKTPTTPATEPATTPTEAPKTPEPAKVTEAPKAPTEAPKSNETPKRNTETSRTTETPKRTARNDR